MQNNAVSVPSATALTFTYGADTISFATSSRPGMYTARAVTNGFRQVPTTITSNMNLNGVLTFSSSGNTGHTRTTQTFDVATDTSNLRIENIGSNTITIVGKQSSDFLEVRNTSTGSILFQGVLPVTITAPGSYFFGRIRGCLLYTSPSPRD